MRTILTVENIEKCYGNRGNIMKAVDNISFSVDEGGFIGVMRSSDSGKMTLLDCISTIDIVISSHTYINDKGITQPRKNDLGSFHRKGPGFIFQDFSLLSTLTVYENTTFILMTQEVKPAQIGKRTESVAKRLDITGVLQKYPYQMPDGQRQRAASTRVLITNPSLILADESTGALDSKSSHMLLDPMECLNIEYNATIMMVTHDALIVSYTHRILFIEDGKIFSEITRGESSHKDLFNQIMEVATLLGGDTSSVPQADLV